MSDMPNRELLDRLIGFATFSRDSPGLPGGSSLSVVGPHGADQLSDMMMNRSWVLGAVLALTIVGASAHDTVDIECGSSTNTAAAGITVQSLLTA